TQKIARFEEEVLARYQPLFSPENLTSLTAEDFRGFLNFKNNHHWIGLDRLGPAICKDMQKLRKALAILQDESRTVDKRLNGLVPRGEPNLVPRLGRAVLTPILMIQFPDKYGVWNSVSEAGLRKLGVWPEFERSEPFGSRYLKVNDELLALRDLLAVDLWTLDSLLWAVIQESDIPDPPFVGDHQVFGLERQLHDFLRDNWEKVDLGRDWAIYEEDGDPEAGYEYPCAVGRIDLLAKHKREPRWLVIELKRDQSSDQTVGQVARYMGWVREELADAAEKVEGLIIARTSDEGLKYALSAVNDVRVRYYEVKFRLRVSPVEPTS
ncbi:endonuclease NucS domain-containing protein, partial [Gemmatimonadota bacterium]